MVFLMMYGLVASAVRERSDSWLVGESETLRQVALTTPKDALYGRIVGEVAELATQEFAFDGSGKHSAGNTVFFFENGESGEPPLWVGPSQNQALIDAVQKLRIHERSAVSVTVPGWKLPFRVVAADLGPGMGRIYLGLQDTSARSMLTQLLLWFVLGWICMVAFGFVIAVLSMRGTLKRVDAITSAAANIGTADLSSRVASADKPNDEINRLARTFNTMLDRISASVNQLQTLTDSVAHDMKSPITSVRGRLEAALSTDDMNLSRELVAGAIESLDRLSEIVTTSLDVAEAEAGALRLRREPSDLADLIHRVAELYAPAFNERHQTLTTLAGKPVQAMVDQRFIVRLLSNLLENELRYAGDGAQIMVILTETEGKAQIRVRDDGPGFPPNLLSHVFQRFAKGDKSEGHGLGLAFVRAVALAHGGRAWVRNLDAPGGAEIVIEFPTFTADQMSFPPQAESLDPSRVPGVTQPNNDVIVTSS
ncbi:MAG: HAMP domain-containing protein [Acidobacteriaceae bacterium]|nr:HAMP domain-containing protein [Acidobacteriaceae bacterium]